MFVVADENEEPVGVFETLEAARGAADSYLPSSCGVTEWQDEGLHGTPKDSAFLVVEQDGDTWGVFETFEAAEEAARRQMGWLQRNFCVKRFDVGAPCRQQDNIRASGLPH